MTSKQSKKGAAKKGAQKKPAAARKAGAKARKGAAKAAKKGASKRVSAAAKAVLKAAAASKASNSSIRKAAPFLALAVSSGLDIDKLMTAKQSWSRQLLRPRHAGTFFAMSAAPSPAPEQNVVGVGIGERIAGGYHTGVMALKFLVRVKYGDDQLTASDRLPESVNGLPTDVEEVGTFRRFQTQNPRTMIRPAPPGCSVGFEDPGQNPMAGTFGALVKRGTRRFILSNNHVLAGENRLPLGAPTFQPGFLDAGVPPSTSPIGRLSAFVELRASQNFVDCAIAEVDDPTLVTNSIIKIGVPKGATAAQNNMIVHKFGRTTGYRVGFIETTVMDVLVDYGIGTLAFEDQIIIRGLNGQAFSDEGDSGALVVERNTGRAVGLLFAGSPSHTIANHIGLVFQALNVSLA
jgi:hypothetical protein